MTSTSLFQAPPCFKFNLIFCGVRVLYFSESSHSTGPVLIQIPALAHKLCVNLSWCTSLSGPFKSSWFSKTSVNLWSYRVWHLWNMFRSIYNCGRRSTATQQRRILRPAISDELNSILETKTVPLPSSDVDISYSYSAWPSPILLSRSRPERFSEPPVLFSVRIDLMKHEVQIWEEWREASLCQYLSKVSHLLHSRHHDTFIELLPKQLHGTYLPCFVACGISSFSTLTGNKKWPHKKVNELTGLGF